MLSPSCASCLSNDDALGMPPDGNLLLNTPSYSTDNNVLARKQIDAAFIQNWIISATISRSTENLIDMVKLLMATRNTIIVVFVD